MVIIDTSKKHFNEKNTEKRTTENKETIPTEQEEQLIREKFAMIDDTNLLNTFFVLP